MVSQMYLNEVLQLDKTMGSIKKIDLFLSGCNKKSIEYYKAFCYRNIVLHSIGKTNDALKALYALTTEFSKLGAEEIITICDAIIDITLSVKCFEQARKFIDEKKKHLKVSNAILNTKDEIRLAIGKHDYNRAIAELKGYLKEILTIEESCWGYELLANIYYEVHDYPSYLEIIPQLEKIYQDNLNTLKLIDLEYKKLDIAFNEGNYIKVICEGNRLLNDYDLEVETKLKTATLLLESYIFSKDYRKASIMESNYEEFLEQVSPVTALAFSKASLRLYTETNSLISMKHYQDLVTQYSQNKKKIKQKEALSGQGIIIPALKEAEAPKEKEASKPIPNLHELTKDIQTVYISNMYTKLEKLYATVNNLDEAVKFREIYRTALIELAKFIPFEEAYILYYDHQYLGIHYKKERAYDKRLEYSMIDNTINFLAIAQEQEVYLDIHSTVGNQSIVTQETLENLFYGISIPLFNEDICYGSIAYFASTPFLEQDMVYETLKLVTQMLQHALLFELRQNQVRQSNKKMFFIYENMSSGIKELMEGHIHLSAQAKEILGGLEDLSEQDYKAHIHASDLAKYETKLSEIIKYLSTNQSIEYRYKKNQEYIYVRETFFPSYEKGKISIYSLLEDCSKEKNKEKDLYQMAFTNPVSKLETEAKLGMDIQENMSHRKLSVAVLDIHDFKLYEELYGLNYANQMIYAVALEFKSFFQSHLNVKLYHLGFDRYAALLIDTNDKRSVDNLLFKSFERVSSQLNLLNSRIKLYFNCGVYRLSKSASIEDPYKILDYAYDALADAKEVNTLEHHISHYDSEASKLRFNENQLVTHISEAIDHNRLGILYKQLVDIEKKEVYAYVAKISLDNYDIDYSYMKKVIERRGLEELINKYMISSCSKELRMLYDASKSSLPILISLNAKVIPANIVSFIETQNNFYKTTKHLIFYYESGQLEELFQLKSLGYKVASGNVIDVFQKKIDYFVYDIASHGIESIKEIKALCDSKNIQFIAANVSTKEELLQLEELKVTYVFGNYYKKSIRMKKVIEKVA